MNRRNFLLVIIFTLGYFLSQAQSNLLNAKTPAEIGKKSPSQLISDNDKALPYGNVDDRDILMGKTTWETIDLDERINFPLYYPIDTANIGKERRSLFRVLLNGIKNGKITEVYEDSYFTTKKTYKDIVVNLTYNDTLRKSEEAEQYYQTYQLTKNKKLPYDPQYINPYTVEERDIKSYKIKGYWYFNKRLSELKYRLIGICPFAPEASSKKPQDGITVSEILPIPLFWLYFPSVRDVLHDAKSFNNRNSAMPVDFDTLLNSRKFNAVIYQEENVQGDRAIAGYKPNNAMDQLLEAERIKEKIRDFEHDMWNY